MCGQSQFISLRRCQLYICDLMGNSTHAHVPVQARSRKKQAKTLVSPVLPCSYFKILSVSTNDWFQRPYFCKSAARKPFKLPTLYMLSIKAVLLFYDITNKQCGLKGLSVILDSKLHFFPNPQICLHIQGKLRCNNLPIEYRSVTSSNFCFCILAFS